MSAILGRVEIDGRAVDVGEFSRCFATLKQYGPDLSECCTEGPVAVGRHLLRVAPASERESPPQLIDGLIVIADAILDNRPELAGALGLSSARCSDMSDTDLIRGSFLRWGESCVDRLVGDFAFAAIRPDRREVFLARDHIGARPLFWALRDHTIVFGTGIAGLVAFKEWQWPIDKRVVAEHLLNPLIPLSKPLFRDVHSVPAGSFVAFRREQVSAKRWWRPSRTPVSSYGSASEVVATCRSLLERAISDRIDSDGRIGAHFSGGVDSTGVAVIGARALKSRSRSLARAYAWSPPVSEHYPADHAKDERRPIQQLADAEGIPVVFGIADGANFLQFTRRSMEFEGEADLADEIPVLRAGGDDGLRVMLSGWGGDEAFSAHGNGFLAHLALKGRIGQFKKFAHHYSRSLRRIEFLLPLIWRQVIRPLLPGPLHQFTSPYRAYIRSGSHISNSLLQQNSDLVEERRSNIKFGPNPNENLWRHITAGHITMRMESWAAWSAPYGFQYRYPLTDRRLLEFLFALPPEQVFMNNQPRGLARAVLADCIPPTAGKNDIANERLRSDTRDAAWRAIARGVAGGEYEDDCPWLDMIAFRARALTPADQRAPENTLLFAELFAAVRVWHLYRRASQNGWL